MITFVLCGNYREFDNYCWEALDMSARVAARFGIRYMESWQSFRGYSNFKVVVYGNPGLRSDAEGIFKELEYLMASGRLEMRPR